MEMINKAAVLDLDTLKAGDRICLDPYGSTGTILGRDEAGRIEVQMDGDPETGVLYADPIFGQVQKIG